MSAETPCSVCYRLDGTVTSNFIRNRGVPTVYDTPWPDTLVNNPAPTPVYVRLVNGVFNLNGKQMPRLLLTQGRKYQFNIVTNGVPFYFSTTPGGPVDVFGIPPVDYDLRTYTATEATPKKFYYTSPDGKVAGEVVIV